MTILINPYNQMSYTKAILTNCFSAVVRFFYPTPGRVMGKFKAKPKIKPAELLTESDFDIHSIREEVNYIKTRI